MTLRIVEKNTELGTEISLHGWLTACEVPELERATPGAAGAVLIDLGQLAGADPAGLEALRRQQERGAQLVGATRYIELLLERMVRPR
jgi:hypothetical protein